MNARIESVEKRGKATSLFEDIQIRFLQLRIDSLEKKLKTLMRDASKPNGLRGVEFESAYNFLFQERSRLEEKLSTLIGTPAPERVNPLDTPL